DFSSHPAISFNPLEGTYFSMQMAAQLVVHVLFFAGVFSLMSWRNMIDPLRTQKLSLAHVGLGLVWAAMFSHVLNFAPLLMCMLVVIIAIAIQLSASWVSSEKRQLYASGD
ncbi:MAG: hypothetical protein AAGA30_20540, partial [Planctomycetota bacterium]